MSKFEKDGWCYDDPPAMDGKDARRLVTLERDGMVWVGIRAWNHAKEHWMNNGEPTSEKVKAWRWLPEPAAGWYDRGILMIPPYGEKL